MKSKPRTGNAGDEPSCFESSQFGRSLLDEQRGATARCSVETSSSDSLLSLSVFGRRGYGCLSDEFVHLEATWFSE